MGRRAEQAGGERRKGAPTSRAQAQKLLALLGEDPFRSPPSFEKLVGNLAGFYARRSNIQHRMVYRVDREHRVVHVLRMWTHYDP